MKWTFTWLSRISRVVISKDNIYFGWGIKLCAIIQSLTVRDQDET